MHDYFEILGVSPDASVEAIRRACRRRASAQHPDFLDVETDGAPAAAPDATVTTLTELADAAVDFVEMDAVVGRMLRAFFLNR